MLLLMCRRDRSMHRPLLSLDRQVARSRGVDVLRYSATCAHWRTMSNVAHAATISDRLVVVNKRSSLVVTRSAERADEHDSSKNHVTARGFRRMTSARRDRADIPRSLAASCFRECAKSPETLVRLTTELIAWNKQSKTVDRTKGTCRFASARLAVQPPSSIGRAVGRRGESLRACCDTRSRAVSRQP